MSDYYSIEADFIVNWFLSSWVKMVPIDKTYIYELVPDHDYCNRSKWITEAMGYLYKLIVDELNRK